MSVEEPSEKTSLATHLLAEQAGAERAAVQAGAASIWRHGVSSGKARIFLMILLP